MVAAYLFESVDYLPLFNLPLISRIRQAVVDLRPEASSVSSRWGPSNTDAGQVFIISFRDDGRLLFHVSALSLVEPIVLVIISLVWLLHNLTNVDVDV